MMVMVPIFIAVEGIVDEAIARRIVGVTGGTVSGVYGNRGKGWLQRQFGGYVKAAKRSPWFVLVDLDADCDRCARRLVEEWLAKTSEEKDSHLCFRIAVHAVESWLLADLEGVAEFLRIDQKQLPQLPDELQNPKETMVELARRSRRNDVRKDMAPPSGAQRKTGRAYNSRLIEFARDYWDPWRAAKRSPSLDRALRCLKRMIQSATSSSQ
ncbi:MAG: DUF4276 family protein [Acidobacteriota bacterium]